MGNHTNTERVISYVIHGVFMITLATLTPAIAVLKINCHFTLKETFNVNMFPIGETGILFTFFSQISASFTNLKEYVGACNYCSIIKAARLPSQQTYIDLLLVECWASVVDGGSALV